MNGSFTSELWQGIGDIYRGILVHPFLTGLTDGSLPHGTFAFYVVQDALYLRQYAQALAAVASRAPDAAGTEMFARHAADAVAVEQALHKSLLADLGIDPAAASAAKPAPTNLAYTSYLLAAIYGGSYADGVGRFCRATGSTGRSARNCSAAAHPTRVISGGSIRTAERSSVRRSARCWPWPMSWARSWHRVNASACTSTSGSPAATNGCSGIWGTGNRPGRSDQPRALHNAWC